MLLRLRASVDAAGPQQDTPLMLAASAGHAPTPELPLERGADANAVGTEGKMPLVAAAEAGHVAVDRELLYHDETLDLNSKDRSAITILVEEPGHGETVRLLRARNVSEGPI